MTSQPRIAVVGAGTMGQPMARRLVACGRDLVVYDLDRERAAATGAAVAATLAEAVRDAEVVLLSLPHPDVVREVATGAGGLAEACAPGTTVVDASTITPALARELAAALGARGVAYLDAPVSGGPVSIPAGGLAMMVGGDLTALERIRPVVEDLAGYVAHVGPSGAGQAVKLANNLMVGAAMVGISEACALIAGEGIDAASAYDVFRHTTGHSRLLDARFPIPGVDEQHPATHGYAPRFALSLMAKDLGLVMDMAAERGLSLPLCAQVLETYEAAIAAGVGDRDFSAVFLQVSKTHGREAEPGAGSARQITQQRAGGRG